MTRLVTVHALAILLCTVLVGCAGSSPMESARSDGWSHYGSDDLDRGSVVSLGAMEGDEVGVIVEGTITDVCAKKGCWMRMTDGQEELFVRFKDYGFFVPMNATGHRVVVHGTAVSQVADVAELRHYAEDAGKSPAEIAAITEPETRVTFYADSVYIEGAGLDAPFAPSATSQPAG
jgi:hypothetical protein